MFDRPSAGEVADAPDEAAAYLAKPLPGADAVFGPATLRGEITFRHAQALADAIGSLDDESVAAVEGRVLAKGTGADGVSPGGETRRHAARSAVGRAAARAGHDRTAGIGEAVRRRGDRSLGAGARRGRRAGLGSRQRPRPRMRT